MASDRIARAAAAMWRGRATSGDSASIDTSEFIPLEDFVQQAIGDDDFARATLKDLRQYPQYDDPEVALATFLSELSRRDPEFAERLEDLVLNAVADDKLRSLEDSLPERSKVHIDRLRQGR